MRILTVLLIIFLLIGCANAPGMKTGETIVAGGPVVVTVAKGIRCLIPGYRTRKIRRLDFYIEIKERELRLEELRLETKKARMAYKGLE